MVNDFDKEKNVLDLYNFSYISELILKYSYEYEHLIITEHSYECLLDIFNYLLSDFLFNKKQILVLSNTYINEIKESEIITSLGSRVIQFKENIDIDACVKEQILSLPQLTGKTLISKVNLLSRNIDKNVNLIRSILSFFTDQSEKSLSILDKYTITNNCLSKYDYLFKYYKIFRIKKPLEKYSYSEIYSTVNKLINSDVIKRYIRYRRFTNNNMIKILKDKINYNELDLIISKIDELVKDAEFKISFIESQYTSDFIETFSINPDMKYNDINNLVNIVNFKYNYHLLTQKKKNKFFGLFKNKKNLIDQENNLTNFVNFENQIKNEYLINLENLNFHLNKLKFLKDILKKEAYNELFNKLIKGEDLKEILVLYKKIINLCYGIKDIKKEIESLNPIESEILNYCYDNIEDKNNITNILINIPKLKLYLEIEDQELKNTEILNKYENFDEIIIEICGDVVNRSNLLLPAINSTWDNILRENLKISSNDINKADLSDEEIFKSLFPCIISNLDTNTLINLNNKNLIFDKIIIIEDVNKIDNEKLNYINTLSNDIIIFSKNSIDSNINFKDYKNILVSETRKLIISNSENNILTEIQKYLEKLGYLIERNSYVDEFNINLLIKDSNSNIITAVILDGEIIEKENYILLKDIYLSKSLKDKNINLYRIWTRNWWLNKTKELSKLANYLNEI